MTLTIRPTAWSSGEKIPVKYTADGEDVSPPLAFGGVPPRTAALALVCEDPDAPNGTFVHWVIYNIPPSSTGLPENVPRDPTLPDGSRQGANSWENLGYGGPAPPGHKPHRYFFRLYALRETLGAGPGLSAEELDRAMHGRVLESAECVGRYARE